MNNILVVNSGSSSLKFQLINAKTEKVVLKGLAEKLGLDGAHILIKHDGKETDRALTKTSTHGDALRALFDYLDEHDLSRTISAVGQRVVHGGELFHDSVLITDEVLDQIKTLTPLAPLHNPASLLAIEGIRAIHPDLPQIAVFDTAFHSTMPPEAYRYSVPAEWYKKHGVRRYGFHGTSYKFITEKTAEILGKKPNDVDLIIAHIGSGVSISAIKNGQSVANTMGFTPLAGLPMGTRSGNIDPGIIPFIMERENLTAQQVIDKLNNESGHRATSGVSGDMRDINAAVEQGNADAKLAFDILVRKIAKYIAGFMPDLPHLDALVFTAGVGENGFEIREAVVGRLGILGFKLDDKLNRDTIGWEGREGLISAPDSKYPIYALGTNEELMIARDTVRIVKTK